MISLFFCAFLPIDKCFWLWYNRGPAADAPARNFHYTTQSEKSQVKTCTKIKKNFFPKLCILPIFCYRIVTICNRFVTELQPFCNFCRGARPLAARDPHMAKRAGPGRHIRPPDRKTAAAFISARSAINGGEKFFPKNLTKQKKYDIILKKTFFKDPQNGNNRAYFKPPPFIIT